jgi:hypothetical protein
MPSTLFFSFFIQRYARLSAADMIQQVLSIATIDELKINVVFLHFQHHERTFEQSLIPVSV